MPQAQLDGLVSQWKSQSVPQGLKDALDKLQAARKAAEGFPKFLVSDGSGRFSFDNVPTGRYTIVTEREGYYGVPPAGSNALTQSSSASIDATSSSTALPDVVVRMIPGGLISGQIRDANGQVQANIQVQAFSVHYQAGLPILEPLAGNETNDRGEFRLFWLPPGEYFVAATTRPVPGARGGGRGGPSSSEVAPKTFYPNLPQPSLSTPINVKIGEEVSGININLRTFRAAKLSGQVINALGPRPDNPDGTPNPVSSATLMMLQRDMSVPDDTGARTVGAVDVTTGSGKFEINGILPGLYDLYGRINDPRGSAGSGGATNAWGRIPIEVLDRDLADLSVVVHASVEMKGIVTIDGASPGQAASRIRVALQPDGSSSKLPNYNGVLGRQQIPTPEGAFTVTGIAEGNYRFVANGLQANAYVEEILAGPRPVYDTGIYVADKPVDSVQILIRTSGGSVQGSVSTPDRKPAARATVVLVPESDHRQNASLFKTATTNGEGVFTIRGIHPGTYTVLAWESVPAESWLNSVFMSKYESRGRIVNVTPSSSMNVEIPLIPRN
jgi:hypothetical protein